MEVEITNLIHFYLLSYRKQEEIERRKEKENERDQSRTRLVMILDQEQVMSSLILFLS